IHALSVSSRALQCAGVIDKAQALTPGIQRSRRSRTATMMQNRYLVRSTRECAAAASRAAPPRLRIVTFVMSETSLTSSARRRLVALALVAGATLGLLATSGLTTAVPVAADVSGRTAVTDRSELRAELAS